MAESFLNQEKKKLDEILQRYKEEFLKAINLKEVLVKLTMFYFICLDILKIITKEEKEEILQALQEFKDKLFL